MKELGFSDGEIATLNQNAMNEERTNETKPHENHSCLYMQKRYNRYAYTEMQKQNIQRTGYAVTDSLDLSTGELLEPLLYLLEVKEVKFNVNTKWGEYKMLVEFTGLSLDDQGCVDRGVAAKRGLWLDNGNRPLPTSVKKGDLLHCVLYVLDDEHILRPQYGECTQLTQYSLNEDLDDYSSMHVNFEKPNGNSDCVFPF